MAVDHSTFWESIRNHSGWGWALGEISRNPKMMDAIGPKWSESPLHWAMLGHLEATSIMCAQRPGLLFALDSEGRSPLDWAAEKIYFLRQQQEGELAEEHFRSEKMISDALACALFALNWAASQELDGPWSGDRARFVRLALSAGELDLANHAMALMSGGVGPEVWLCGLAGLWRSPEAIGAYRESLLQRHGLAPTALAFGRPLGLHVAQLWAEGQVTAERAVWFHEAGFRLDQETEDESIEVFCAKDGEAGAARLEKLGRRLNW